MYSGTILTHTTKPAENRQRSKGKLKDKIINKSVTLAHPDRCLYFSVFDFKLSQSNVTGYWLHLKDFYSSCSCLEVFLIHDEQSKHGCVSLRKSKIGFLNPKESENGFCVSLLDRSIQDLSDQGASKEPMNPLWKWTLRFL